MTKTWDELYEEAERDHGHWRGKVVQVRYAGVSDGFDLRDVKFSQSHPATVADGELDWHNDCQEDDDDGGLLDVHYTASGDVPGHPEQHIWWIPGPTYYIDGRVVYPEWWPKNGTPAHAEVLRHTST